MGGGGDGLARRLLASGTIQEAKEQVPHQQTLMAPLGALNELTFH